MAFEIPHAKTQDTDVVFTKLQVKNLEQAAAFYGSVVGLVEMNRVEAEIAGRKVTEVVFMPTSAGGAMFILASFADTEVAAANEVILGLVTQNIAGFIARAEQAGGRVLEATREVPGMGGMQVAFLADPEGHVLQITQPGG